MTYFNEFTKLDATNEDGTIMTFKEFQQTETYDKLFSSLKIDFANIAEPTLLIMFNFWYTKHVINNEKEETEYDEIEEQPKGEITKITVYDNEEDYYKENPQMKDNDNEIKMID